MKYGIFQFSFYSIIRQVCLVFFIIVTSTSLLSAQATDSMPMKMDAALLKADTLNLEDKFIIAELEKVQYAQYSEDLKKAALQKVIENQKLQNASLQQKLQNEQLKAESDRKQAEAESQQREAEYEKEIQTQKIKQLQIAELEQRLTLENRTRNFLYSGVALLGLLGISLLWSNWQLKKRNRSIQNLSAENIQKEQEKQQILSSQNETLEKQVTQRTSELNHSLTELKSTQNQLIQKEKLASLGELTAGIAHEIQNPLNFVNNFSELSVDLAKELKEEVEKFDIPEKDKEYVGEILTDLTSNQEKINHHGKRASSIVKGMLEHSRTSTGERAMTDINALADEYLRLSYHGMRAKDKNFNADYNTDFDENLPKINIVPQDIGRVLLNLMNNAFYAVHERNLRGFENLAGLETYTPSVVVSTQQLVEDANGNNQIIIKVKDNGNGIPENIKAKIFQPFFTTKPTGQGTGLGLSLAYDIVTKGHGGSLEVVSTEGVGSELVIKLPI